MIYTKRKNTYGSINVFKEDGKAATGTKKANLFRELVKYHGERCSICNIKVYKNTDFSNEMTIEHVVGQKKNKYLRNKWTNLVLCCSRCNRYRSKYQTNQENNVINFTKKSEAKLFRKNTYIDLFTGEIVVKSCCRNDIIKATIINYGLNTSSLVEKRIDFLSRCVDEKNIYFYNQLIKSNDLDNVLLEFPTFLFERNIFLLGKKYKNRRCMINRKKYEERWNG